MAGSVMRDLWITIGQLMLDLWDDQAAWSQKTFGSDEIKGPIGSLAHLALEAKEAIDKPDDIEEYADCLLLIMDAVRRAGISPKQWILTARNKLEKNKLREWPPIDYNNIDSCVQHIKIDDTPLSGDRRSRIAFHGLISGQIVVSIGDQLADGNDINEILLWLNNDLQVQASMETSLPKLLTEAYMESIDKPGDAPDFEDREV